jgi:hypothetical protein
MNFMVDEAHIALVARPANGRGRSGDHWNFDHESHGHTTTDQRAGA